MDYEVKADTLDASFDEAGQAAEIAQLRREVALMKAARRPALEGAKAAGDEGRKRFVDQYLRKGLETGLELKALTRVDGEGGFAVPREIDAMIAQTLKDISPVRRVANVVQASSAQYRKLIATGGFQADWAAETGTRAETTTPTFREIVPPGGDMFANPAASQGMLDDAMFDVEGWLSGEVAREFARLEGTAFIKGTGTNQPKGFLTYTVSALRDATRAWGELQYVPSGVAADLTSPDPLIDLVFSLRPAYRQGAVLMMNSATTARVRKLKDSTGQFLFQPSLVSGTPSTLLGYPVVEAEDMDNIGAGLFPIAFGNFREGYVIAERPETGILRDPFTRKPFVHFYASKRVGGAVVNFEAIKLLRISLT